MKESVIGYTTNCCAGESAAELIAAVRTEIAAIRKLLRPSEPLNLSVRISAQAAKEFSADARLLDEFRAALDAAGASLVSVDAFPVSAPKKGVYKNGIYVPDWSSRARLAATIEIARIAAALVPEGTRVTLTTLTGTYRGWAGADSPSVEESCARNLLDCAQDLDMLSAESGRELVLALEPEPFTTAEALPDTLRYFRTRLFGSSQQAFARRRLAVNLDLCHAAVMFEDPVENLRAYAREGIQVAGLHVSAALRLERVAENTAGLAALSSLDEPVYLHQVSAVDRSGNIVFRSPDLGEFLELGREQLGTLAEARVHFHVPVFASEVDGLGTTADLIAPALSEARAGNHTNLFIVETYAWKLLAGGEGTVPSVAEGIAHELDAIRAMLP